MYGVPVDLTLDLFLNAELIYIGLGVHQIQFDFFPQGNISVEGMWKLESEKGEIVDLMQSHEKREFYKIHKIMGMRVVSCQVTPPTSFSLRFENGYSLTIYDSSEMYESFSIQPGDIFV